MYTLFSTYKNVKRNCLNSYMYITLFSHNTKFLLWLPVLHHINLKILCLKQYTILFALFVYEWICL